MKSVSTALLLGIALLLSAGTPAANSRTIGVQCDGTCDTVTLGAICDSYVQESMPTAVTCSHPQRRDSWRPYSCGVATCARNYSRTDYLERQTG